MACPSQLSMSHTGPEVQKQEDKPASGNGTPATPKGPLNFFSTVRGPASSAIPHQE
jgi:hypothetical protein